MEGSPRRIVVAGVTGSGKSTLARRVAEALGLPYVAVDDLAFEANWAPVSKERQRALIGELAAGEAWVFDAAYSQWSDLVWPRAELAVWLDYPGPLVFARLLRRTVRRVRTGEAVCNGNRETLRRALGRESILLWFFKSRRRKRVQARTMARERPGTTLRFARPSQAARWLAGLGQNL